MIDVYLTDPPKALGSIDNNLLEIDFLILQLGIADDLLRNRDIPYDYWASVHTSHQQLKEVISYRLDNILEAYEPDVLH